MSIGKRFIDLARAELNSLLDFAARRGDGDDDGDGGGTAGDDSLSGFSRQQLEEELARRRSAREEVEEAIRGGRGPTASEARDQAQAQDRAQQRAQARRPTPGATRPAGTASSRPASVSETRKVELAYAALELPPGASFETVRIAYRNLMRKYHPDHHTSSPEAQRAANELAQRLTEAYKLLQSRLER